MQVDVKASKLLEKRRIRNAIFAVCESWTAKLPWVSGVFPVRSHLESMSRGLSASLPGARTGTADAPSSCGGSHEGSALGYYSGAFLFFRLLAGRAGRLFHKSFQAELRR